MGFNIDRSGRTESYAIPANIVITRLYDLMSGNLAVKTDDQEEEEEDTEVVTTTDESADSSAGAQGDDEPTTDKPKAETGAAE